MKRRMLTLTEQEFINKLTRFASANELWLDEIMSPMMSIPHQVVDSKEVWGEIQVDDMRFSRLFFGQNSKTNGNYYRSPSFLGFNRFNHFHNSWQLLKTEIIEETITKPKAFYLIMVILFETSTEQESRNLVENKSLLRKRFQETSLDFVRLVVHHRWVGKYREQIAKEVLSQVLGEEYEVADATKQQDVNHLFDLLIKKEGQPVLGISVKSPRYAQSYHNFSPHRDGRENLENLGHLQARRLYNCEVHVIVVDEKLTNSELTASIEAQINNSKGVL